MSTPDLKRRIAKCEERRTPREPFTFVGYAHDANGELIEIFPVPGRRPDPDAARACFTFSLDRPQFRDRKFDA